MGGPGALAVNAATPCTFGVGETIFPWHPLAALGAVTFGAVLVLGLARLRLLWEWGWAPVLGSAGVLALGLTLLHAVRDLPALTLLPRLVGALPPLLLVAAVGLAALRRAALVAALAILLAASGVAAANYFSGRSFLNPVYTLPTREVGEWLEERVSPSDVVAADSDLGLGRYYRGPAPLLSAQDAAAVLGAAGEWVTIWLLTLGRDGTAERRPVELEAWLEAHGRVVEERGFVEQDATYRRLKERLGGAEGYRHKLRLRTFLVTSLWEK